MSQQDVDQFLWEIEQALSHLDGPERRRLLREAEQRVHAAAEQIAQREGAEDLTWFHYVQATAEVGPPEALAAELTGQPLPDKQAVHTRLWVLAGAVGLAIVAVLAIAFFSHGTLEALGTWSGQGDGGSQRETVTFNVSEEAESVFLELAAAPTTANGTVTVTVLDGSANLVYEDRGTLADHLEVARYLTGEPGTWRVIVDLERFHGSWKVQARQELP